MLLSHTLVMRGIPGKIMLLSHTLTLGGGGGGSCSKFGKIPPSGLGGDSVTNGQTDRQTDGRSDGLPEK